MDLTWVTELSHYRYGLTLFATLAVLPALVSGNMLIHELDQWRRQRKLNVHALALNAIILAVSLTLIAGAILQWR